MLDGNVYQNGMIKRFSPPFRSLQCAAHLC
jgi:hypothetical protein